MLIFTLYDDVGVESPSDTLARSFETITLPQNTNGVVILSQHHYM